MTLPLPCKKTGVSSWCYRLPMVVSTLTTNSLRRITQWEKAPKTKYSGRMISRKFKRNKWASRWHSYTPNSNRLNYIQTKTRSLLWAPTTFSSWSTRNACASKTARSKMKASSSLTTKSSKCGRWSLIPSPTSPTRWFHWQPKARSKRKLLWRKAASGRFWKVQVSWTMLR